MSQISLVERPDGATATLEDVEDISLVEGALVAKGGTFTTLFAPGAWLTVTTVLNTSAEAAILRSAASYGGPRRIA